MACIKNIYVIYRAVQKDSNTFPLFVEITEDEFPNVVTHFLTKQNFLYYVESIQIYKFT